MRFGTTGLARERSLSGFSIPLATARRSKVSLAYIPLPVAVILVSLLFPREFDFSVEVLRLNCTRLALLLWTPMALVRLASRRGATFRSFDYLFIGAYAYYVFAVFSKETFHTATQTGGIIFLEAVGGYLVARAYIRNEDQFLATVKLLFWCVMLVGAMAIPESILFNHLVKNFAASLTGLPAWPPGESRLGLLRAMAVFDHAIHYGVFCASVFALVWFSEEYPLKRFIRATLAAGATFFSLSSGPLLGIGIVLAGAVWERSTRYVPYRVWLTIALVAVLYLLASLVTNRSPFKILITSLVFVSDSAYYRMLIWDYGVDNVLNNPWIGVSLGSWERPAWMPSDSLDNHWLAMAIWGGLPSAALYALSIIVLLRAASRDLQAPERAERRRCRYAWSATVLVLCAVGMTVAYWGALAIYVTFCLGMGAWLAEGRHGRKLQARGRFEPAPAHAMHQAGDILVGGANRHALPGSPVASRQGKPRSNY